MTEHLTIRDADEMTALGRRIGRHLRAGDAVALVGPLGAGKTTLTRGIAQGLGVAGPVASPTFVIARRHRGPRVDLVHCDAYRISGDDDLADVVGDPDDVVTVVEWGDDVMSALTDSWLEVVIERATGERAGADDHDPRSVRFVRHGSDWENRDVTSWAREQDRP